MMMSFFMIFAPLVSATELLSLAVALSRGQGAQCKTQDGGCLFNCDAAAALRRIITITLGHFQNAHSPLSLQSHLASFTVLLGAIAINPITVMRG
jgi:hypothetical protein